MSELDEKIDSIGPEFLLEILSALRELKEDRKGRLESSEIHELSAALAAAQGEMRIAEEDTPSHYGKYADFATVVKTARVPLSKHGLSIIQRPIYTGEVHILCTRLCHKSGQWIESRMLLSPPRTDIQSMGSYISYVKRYCYAAIIGLASGYEDDDGESALSIEEKRVRDTREKRAPRISRDQAMTLGGLFNALSTDVQEVMKEELQKKFKIEKLTDLNSKDFDDAYKMLAVKDDVGEKDGAEE